MCGRVGRVRLNASSLIFLLLSRFHLLQIDKSINKSLLLAISLKPTNKSLPPQTQTKPNQSLRPPSPSNPQIDKPTNSHKPKPIRKEERMKERVEESEREREREREREKKNIQTFPLSIISSDEIVEDQWL
jgi:hypothetical protein